jgi:porphobilinogen synthase
VRETRLSVDSLIYPVFVVPGADVQPEIPSMPGVFHQLVDRLVEDARAVAVLGIPALQLFRLPHAKAWLGSQAWAVDDIVQQAIRAIKRAAPSLVVIADTACANTPRMATVEFPGRTTSLASSTMTVRFELIARTAVTQSAAGADIVPLRDA